MKYNREDIRILIIDDEMIIIRDIEDILDTMGLANYESVLSIENAREAISQHQPDLVICDINLQDKKMNGIAFMEEVKSTYSDIGVIYVSAYSNPDIVSSTQYTYPLNYIVKPFDEKQLIAAINLALNSIISENSIHPDIEKLTEAEIKILYFISIKLTTNEIADKLFVSTKTVKNHRYNICKKLTLKNEANSLLKWVLDNKAKIPRLPDGS